MKKIYLTALYLSLFLYACHSQQRGEFHLDASTFNAKLQEKQAEAIVLDVRTPEEFSSGYLPSAQNINYHDPDFAQKINSLDKNKPYFVYCLGGGRSAEAVRYMQENGFKEVYNLRGGIMAWKRANLPVVQKNTYTPKQDKILYSDYQTMISSKPKVLIDFYAPWCVPCQRMKPDLEALQQELDSKEYAIVRINVEENKNLSDKLNVNDIPLLIFYKNGKEVWKHNGFIEKNELKKVLVK